MSFDIANLLFAGISAVASAIEVWQYAEIW